MSELSPAGRSDEDEAEAGQSVSEFSSVVQGTARSAKNFDIPLCCVCLEDRYCVDIVHSV